jgi:hypothetical protein
MYKAFEVTDGGQRRNLRLSEVVGRDDFDDEASAVKFMRGYVRDCTTGTSGPGRTFEVVGPSGAVVQRAHKSAAPLFTKATIRYSR